MSFKLKTLLLFLAISLIPYAITVILVGNSFKTESTAKVKLDLQTNLSTIADLIDRHLKSLKKDIDFLSHSDVMNDIYTKDLDKRISNLLELKKENLNLLDDLNVLNLDMEVIASSNSKLLGAFKNPKDAFILQPILSSFNQKCIGYLFLSYQHDNLLHFLDTHSQRQFYLLDKQEVSYLKGKTFKDFLQVAVSLKEYPFTLVLEEDKAYAYQLLNKYQQWFIFALLAGIIIISVIAFIFASRLIKPILLLSQTASHITKTQDYTVQIPYKSNDEVGQLAHAFEEMLLSVNTALEDNKLLSKEIEETQREVVFTMGAIGESRSKETGNHVKRVAEYSKILALHYGLSQQEAEMLKQASPMHDIGKVAIPDAILNKPGRFTEEEFEHMKKHADLGYEMLKHSERSLLKMASIVAYEHHEKWDGSGYPNQTKGEEIHIYGRITALADVFDALGSERVYKKAWDDEKIFKLFHEERAKHFDPKLIDIFFEHLDEFLKVRDTFKD